MPPAWRDQDDEMAEVRGPESFQQSAAAVPTWAAAAVSASASKKNKNNNAVSLQQHATTKQLRKRAREAASLSAEAKRLVAPTKKQQQQDDDSDEGESLEAMMKKRRVESNANEAEDEDEDAFDEEDEDDFEDDDEDDFEDEDVEEEEEDEEEDETKKALRELLGRTDPVLTTKQQQQRSHAPTMLNTIHLNGMSPKDMAWHPSGDALIVTTDRTVDTYHVNGRYSEKVSSVAVRGRRLQQSALTASGEAVVALAENTYTPLLLTLATGAVTPLTFMDVRIGASHVVGVKGKKVDPYPSSVVMRPHDTQRQQFVMPLGSQLVFGALADGCVTGRVTLASPCEDVVFCGDTELAAAVGNKVVFYDVRKTGKVLRTLADEGSMQVTRLAYQSSVLAVGSSSGVVNLYVGGATTPSKTMMNLSTSVDLLAGGHATGGGGALVMGSSQQKNGFRFVDLANMTVASNFPAMTMRHQFLQCMAFSEALPVFSVGEQGRIVTYKC